MSSKNFISKSSDVYSVILRWIYDDYSYSLLANSIRDFGEEEITKAVNGLLDIGYTLIKAVSDESGQVIQKCYEKISAFILYHWDGTFTLRRSLINALCNLYNIAFVMLRCSMDMLFQGLLFQSLSQRKFRDSDELEEFLNQIDAEKAKELKRLIKELKNFLQRNPEEASSLEENSAHIFDILEQIHQPRPEIRPTYKLLAKWGYFHPIEKPEKAIARLYGKLSFNAHEHFSALDVGRAILEGAEIFEVPQPFLKGSMEEYLKDFQEVLNFWKISEQNLLKYSLNI